MPTLTLALNLSIYAGSQYVGFPFNSYCVFAGKVLAAGPEGIHEIESGDTDNGQPIAALIEFAKSKLGSGQPKHVRRYRLNGKSSGNLMLTVRADDGPGFAHPVMVRTPNRYATMFEPGRRDVRGVYFHVALENLNGCHFSLDSITLDVIHTGTRETPA